MLDSKITDRLKVEISNLHKCPICEENIPIGLENKSIKEIEHKGKLHVHIVLHGDPLHAMIAYIDKNNSVRSINSTDSIEIKRDNSTLTQILGKWSNPY